MANLSFITAVGSSMGAGLLSGTFFGTLAGTGVLFAMVFIYTGLWVANDGVPIVTEKVGNVKHKVSSTVRGIREIGVWQSIKLWWSQPSWEELAAFALIVGFVYLIARVIKRWVTESKPVTEAQQLATRVWGLIDMVLAVSVIPVMAKYGVHGGIRLFSYMRVVVSYFRTLFAGATIVSSLFSESKSDPKPKRPGLGYGKDDEEHKHDAEPEPLEPESLVQATTVVLDDLADRLSDEKLLAKAKQIDGTVESTDIPSTRQMHTEIRQLYTDIGVQADANATAIMVESALEQTKADAKRRKVFVAIGIIIMLIVVLIGVTWYISWSENRKRVQAAEKSAAKASTAVKQEKKPFVPICKNWSATGKCTDPTCLGSKTIRHPKAAWKPLCTNKKCTSSQACGKFHPFRKAKTEGVIDTIKDFISKPVKLPMECAQLEGCTCLKCANRLTDGLLRKQATQKLREQEEKHEAQRKGGRVIYINHKKLGRRFFVQYEDDSGMGYDAKLYPIDDTRLGDFADRDFSVVYDDDDYADIDLDEGDLYQYDEHGHKYWSLMGHESRMTAPMWRLNTAAVGNVKSPRGDLNCVYALGSWIFAWHLLDGVNDDDDVVFTTPQGQLVYKKKDLVQVQVRTKDGLLPIDLGVIPKFVSRVPIKGFTIKAPTVGEHLAMFAKIDGKLLFSTGNAQDMISSTLFNHTVSSDNGWCTSALLNGDSQLVGFHIIGGDPVNTAIAATPNIRDAISRAISGNQ